MSKSMALIAFSALMGIAAIVGMSTDVSSRLVKAFGANQVSAGVKAEMAKNNASSSFAPGSLSAPNGMFSDSEGDGRMGCQHSDSSYNPLDD